MGFTRAEELTSSAVVPPSRYRGFLTQDRALSLSAVYRAFQILSTAVCQLSLDQFRGDDRIPSVALLKSPDIDSTRSAFLEYTVTSLAATGNAYWFLTRSTLDNSVIDIKPINPAEVAVRPATGLLPIRYAWKGKDYTAKQIRHLQLMRLPGHDEGHGPIQAARSEIQGALDVRDYASTWFSDGTVPNGILTTDLPLSPDQAKQYKNAWNGLDAKGEPDPSGHDIRVLGQGLKYDYLTLKPADAQFLETQQFTTTQLARLFGIPASLMLAAVEGSSMTYSNIEQVSIDFVRYTLMAYLREIEEAFSALLPHNNSARFNIDALLRSDTKTRYEAHEIALRAKFKTVAEVRADEGLPFLAGTDKFVEIAAAPAQKEIAANAN